MRYITIFDAKPGMVLGHEILDGHGRLLIVKNTILTPAYIQKLTEYGVFGIYIDDEYSAGIEIEPPIPLELKVSAQIALKERDLDACQAIAKKIVNTFLENGRVSFDMSDLRSYDDYTFTHSVNVAIYACSIGFSMFLTETELENLVLASLLHDLGKLAIPTNILNKPSHLTQEEFALIKTHPVISHEMLSERMDISAHVKNAVLLHHENYDGSGYPRGLSKDNISLLARILHIADVYDALTSARSYKKSYTPFAAAEILKGGSGTLYDPDVVEVFFKSIPFYPKGTAVELSDGTHGIIVENTGENNLRPIVRLKNGTEINLLLPENEHISLKAPESMDEASLEAAEEKRSEMLKPLARANILVVDPKGETFLYLKDSFSYLYDFKHSHTENQALGYIKKDGYPDLVIVDVDGKKVTGNEKHRVMSLELTSHVPVILIGSYSDTETIFSFKQFGIKSYILKPYNSIYIQSEIRRNLKPEKN